jgi:hypothetical protein
MNAALKMPHPGGRPREYDREALAREFEAYIEVTNIPIVAEFAAERGLYKDLLYKWPEFFTLIKTCTTKKEAALERAMLRNEVSTVGAIFSLKQLGWSDRLEQTNKDERMSPEDMCAHLETLGTNLERLLIRTKAKVNATVDGEIVAPPMALPKPGRR